MALLSGESGIGKTFATRQLIIDAEERGFAVFTSKCRPQTEDPLYPVYEALAHFIRHSSISSPQLRELFGEYSPMLPRLSSMIRPLIQHDSYLHGLEQLDSSFSSDKPLYPICLDFVTRLALGRPIVFWVDDIQWADRETLSFLMYAVGQLQYFPIAWILCVNFRRKSAVSRDTLQQVVNYIQNALDDESGFCLELSRYGRSQMSGLITSILGLPAKIPESIEKELYDRSQGVPYVLKTFLDMLRREGSLVESEGEFILPPDLQLRTLPDSLRSAIASRIESAYRLFPESRSVLEVASVLGERFGDAPLDSLLEMCDTYRLLLLIEDNHSLVRSVLEEGLWEFEHVTVRDFVYQALGSRATQIHRKVADLLIAAGSEDYGRIAYHCRQAGDQESCIGNQILQAESWLAQGFFSEASLLFSALWKNPLLFDTSHYLARRFEIEYARALAHFHLSEFDTCLQLIYETTRAFPERNSDFAIVLLRAKCLNKANLRAGFAEARDMLENAISRPEIKGNRYVCGRMAAELVVSYAHLNDFGKSREAFTRAEHLLNPYEAPIELAQLMRKAILFFEPELSEKLLLRAIEIFKRHHVDHEIVRTTNNLATLYMSMGKLDFAKDRLQHALALNSRLGNFAGDYLINNLALVKIAEGDPANALDALRNAEACARRPVCKLIIRINQAAALLKMGRAEVASAFLQKLLLEASEVGEDVYLASIRFNLATSSLVMSRPGEALRHLMCCPIESVRLLGSYYGKHYKELLAQVLVDLGATRLDYVPLSSAMEPSYIDMQFWGD